MGIRSAASVVVSLLWGSCAHASVTYLTQERSISALISFDGSMQSASALDFGAFVDTVGVSATFPAAGGGEGINAAEAGIDCHLDPNRLRLDGTLSGAGGTSTLPGGGTAIEFGNASVITNVAFELDAATMISLIALPRPSLDPEDEFKIKFQSLSGGTVLFELDETSAPEDVNLVMFLEAGQYKIEYEAEVTVSGDGTTKSFGFDLLVPAPATVVFALCPGVLGLRRRR